MLYVKLPFLKGLLSYFIAKVYNVFWKNKDIADKKVEHSFSVSKSVSGRKVRRVIRFIAKRNV